MVNARYDYAMMQPYTGERDAHAIEETMSLLRHALAIMDDPFYREQLPNYDWRYHDSRVLQYFCNLTDYCNRTGLDDAQCREVCGYASRFYELWMSSILRESSRES